jgi:hypothetical protein
MTTKKRSTKKRFSKNLDSTKRSRSEGKKVSSSTNSNKSAKANMVQKGKPTFYGSGSFKVSLEPRVYEVTSTGLRVKSTHVAKANSVTEITGTLGIKPKRVQFLSSRIQAFRNLGRFKGLLK